MTQLAFKSDGNHYFIERSTDLARRFGIEFDDVLSVVAQEVTVRITCAEGVRPIRLLGREGDITGQSATTYLNQVYGRQEKYMLLEVEVPAGREGTARSLADVRVTYVNMATKTPERMSSSTSMRFTASAGTVESNLNAAVMASAVEQIAVERSKLAVSLRDQGKIEEARRVLLENADYLSANAAKLKSQELEDYVEQTKKDAKNLDPGVWESQRKEIFNQNQGRNSQQNGFGNNSNGGGGGFGQTPR
jgi:Ca-activated chloride channel family protein